SVRACFATVIHKPSPDSGTAVYRYNEIGKVTKVTDARSVVTNLTYCNAGRLLSKTFPATPGENFTLTWDQIGGGNKGVGRLTRVVGQGGNVLRTYNNLGQITGEPKVLEGIKHTADYI